MSGEALTAAGIRAAFVNGEATASAICRAALDCIAERNGPLGAVLRVDEARAMARAAVLDRAAGTSGAGPLAAVPVLVKDNICVEGGVTTAGSRLLERFVAPYTATAVERLERSGAIVIGKTNCDEFAMGSSNEHSAFGPARNPWDLSRTPGGSSGGSAAAVAARMAPLALGSDTGGSVRQPAGFCGCVGLRPTYGRVSRYGLVAFSSSLDQIGPIALTVRDAAAALGAMAGLDPQDATTSDAPVPDWAGAMTGDVRGCRLGVPVRLLDGIDDGVRAAFGAALEVLHSRGALIRDVSLEHASLAIAVYYVLATAEASSNLARYDGVRYGYRAAGAADLRGMIERTRTEGFGPEATRRILLGTFVLSAGHYDAYYAKAQRVRALVAADFADAFRDVDVIALPTSPTPAFRLGELVDDPLSMYLADVFTVGASLARLPALSVPCGFTPAGLPVGLQLAGRPFDESTILRVAEAYERDTAFWRVAPSGA
ncbi:MAG TPA: Asp-tRNA(Asn)/Glu-tRNA(Gln) amidotransferase subunit GatA [Vicinamibacterales bacterium]|nr:Asp-tRNA(Asn)/Glu-tRNA(Gln) amidotransferase subunit GatA [Vicinamibacterales bacterium]HOQ59225.1 Asp-tRNA(Asn)/Glu-tRNA(Gln) amidotransferase subunit GatA [Vicinamibacterales bacterium]